MSDTNEIIRPKVIGVGEPFVTASEKEIGYTIDGRKVVNFRAVGGFYLKTTKSIWMVPLAIDEVTRHRKQTTQISNRTTPLPQPITLFPIS